MESMTNVDPEQVEKFLENNSSDLENGMESSSDETEAKEGETPMDLLIRGVNERIGIRQDN